MSWKKHFSRFQRPGALHFAAHSHHPWPDVSFRAQQRAWLDAAARADAKWDDVFGTLIPRAQAHVARELRLPDPSTVCFAPNTHELVMRLWSCLPGARPRVLTTDSEFHSFSRQLCRLEEAGRARVTRVAVEPCATFAQRFGAELRRGRHDLVYFSHVFYNNGYRVPDLDALVRAAPDRDTPVVVDGYHAYMAFPVDLSRIARRAFYLAGGYKYAMAGEGACFMHCPPGYGARPVETGWLASFAALTRAPGGRVPYSTDGLRFLGATFDPTALYRFNAVHDWLQRNRITAGRIRAHVEGLQARFLALRDARGLLPGAALLPGAGLPRGNFLAFRHRRAGAWQRALAAARVTADSRGDRLRIGFGLYHSDRDVAALARTIARVCR